MNKINSAVILAIAFGVMVFAFRTSAQSQGQEIHIYGNGDIHLVGAELFLKNALNFYTIRSWDRSWTMPTDYSTKFQSAYGAPIEPSALEKGHLLEITGKLIFNKEFQDYSEIAPTLIKDLNIKTGEPLPSVAPSEGVATPATPKAITLTKLLKRGSEGEEVKILQNFLKKQKLFPQIEETTGFYGRLTESAVIKFQKANALEAIGHVGTKTRALINSLLNQ